MKNKKYIEVKEKKKQSNKKGKKEILKLNQCKKRKE